MALSPKQKKIAKMAGDPNKIEGEDFKKLRTMKAGEGEGVDLAKKHKNYVIDKVGTVKGYAKEMLGMNKPKETAKKLARAVGRMSAPGAAVTAGTMSYFKEKMSKDKDRLTEKDQEFISDFAGGAKMGGVMKANSGLEIDADILGNRLDKKMTKYLGSKETELHAGYKGDYKEDSGEDRAEKRALKEVMQEAGIKFTGAKYGKMVMARGCKMGRNKPTKLS